MNTTGKNKSKKPAKKTKFAEFLDQSPLTLKDIERMSGVNYTTLNNMKMGRPIKYRERTLRDVAACLGKTAQEVFGDAKKKAKYNTPFEKILIKKDLTIEKVHNGTGLSYNILNNLNMGVPKKISNRTKRDLIEYLEVTEEELFGVAENNDN